jgi:hypothetical protein
MRGGAAAVALVGAGYPLLWRRRCLTWGANRAEAGRAMPGDTFLPHAPLVTTRAVTVYAPPQAIWPWLPQMGPGRGGAYTYDWIENILGLNMHSADRILPEFQDLKTGDVMPLGAHGPRMRVEVVEPERALVISVTEGILTLRAERATELTDKQHTEFRYGSFARVVRLPAGAVSDEATADYKDGVLTLTIPVPETKTGIRTVPVRLT